MVTKLTVTRPVDFVEFRKESILQGIHQRFEEQVRIYRSNIALKTPDRSLTYTEVNGFANSIASEILSVAGTDLAQTALLLPNEPQIIIGILASLKSRKAYVPLDPSYPKSRLQFIIEDTSPKVVLTDDAHVAVAEELVGNRSTIINISQIKLDADAVNLDTACDPLERAYILFTSGSTGRPKGIEFVHRNLLHHTRGLTNHLYFSPSDQVTWLHSASFAASIVDIYCGLANGGTLYPWDVRVRGFVGLADWLKQSQVTTLQWIPSAFRQFLRTVPKDFKFDDIRMVVMASEPLMAREVELFRQHFPVASHIVNQVGTSEAGNFRIYAVGHETPVRSLAVPAGFSPSIDREVVILDQERRELPAGSVGEIAVRSDFMSTGYWRNEVLTREKFIRTGEGGVPTYLTGDLGRLEPDGCLVHLGRQDSQVKIRGYRVELAEIDHVLCCAPNVADATTSVMKNQLGEDTLVGYVVLKNAADFLQDLVEKHLHARLPHYMVPRHYLALDSFPTLPSGKVDRHALPNPLVKEAMGHVIAVRPVTGVEAEVVSLFKELLQLQKADLHTDFFRDGGDSLLTALLLHRIHHQFECNINVDEFTACPTAANLAKLIRVAPSRRNSSGTTQLVDVASGACRNDRKSTAGAAFCPDRIQDLIIINAGNFGREVFSWAEQAISAGAPWKIKGFLDNRLNALSGFTYDAGIVGQVDSYQIETDDVFICAIGDPRKKIRFCTPIIERGGRFINVIHPLASVGKNTKLGVGIVLAPFASISCDATVGDHVSIGSFTNIGHNAIIGNWSQVSSHCGVNGNVIIGESVFLGGHACVIPEKRIGNGAFVGAGSVVLEAVLSDMKVFGNPAIPIGRM